MNIEFLALDDNVDLPLYATEGSSGFDLKVSSFKKHYKGSNEGKSVGWLETLVLRPGDRTLVGCGFSVAIPTGYEMQIRSRSGKSLKEGLIVLNAPGTIDSDYRGEIGAILINTSADAVVINKGDAVAQGVIQAIEKINWVRVNQLSETVRGGGGFGSTDKVAKIGGTEHY